MNENHKLLSASFWSVLGEIFVAATRLILFFAFAALLSPDDFGVVAFCMVGVRLLQLIVENPLRFAVVRAEGSDPQILNGAFVINLLIALTGYVLLCAVAGLSAASLRDHRVEAVLPVMALTVFATAGSAIQMGVLQREYRFRTLFCIRVCASLGALAIGIDMVFTGWSYWSLVGSSLASGAVELVGAWCAAPWRPGRQVSWRATAGLYRFAGWIATDFTITWAAIWLGGFMLGLFRGARELGLYRLGEQATDGIMGTIVDPLNSVFYTSFCDALNKNENTGLLLSQFCRATAIVVPGLAMLLTLVGGALEAALGPTWKGLGEVIALCALARMMSSLPMPLMPYLSAHGYSKANSAIRLLLVLGQIPVFIVSAPHGIVPFLKAVLALDTAVYFLYFLVAYSLTRNAVANLIGRQLLNLAVGCLSCATAFYGVSWAVTPIPASFVAVPIFLVLYGGFLYLSDGATLRSFFATVHDGVFRSPTSDHA